MHLQSDWKIQHELQKAFRRKYTSWPSHTCRITRDAKEPKQSHESSPRILCVCRAKSLQSCATFCNAMDRSPPGSSVRGTLQARILEWVAIPISRESSPPRHGTPALAGRFFTTSATWGQRCVDGAQGSQWRGGTQDQERKREKEAHVTFREAQQGVLKAEDERKQRAAVSKMKEGAKAGAPDL